MKLITPEFVSLFVDYPRYSQSEIKDPTVIAKIFNPCGPQNWYLLEYDHKRKEAFSFVTGMFSDEFGYVSLLEMEAVELPVPGLTLERDLHFTPKPLSDFVSIPK